MGLHVTLSRAQDRHEPVVGSRQRGASWRAVVYGFCFLLLVPSLAAQEFRALWADTFHPALRNSTEVSQLVANARAGRFNAVIVEVRKRGDAYYNSNFEPKAADVSPSSFDPLADLIAKAHNTSNGQRIEVHAWIVTYNIWNNETTPPPQANHPYRLHPDWLTKNNAGETFDGSNYAFDPAHPEVQKHTFNVALDIVSRYDVDGLHFDYIRYAGTTWGYNDVAVERFRQLTGRAGTPVGSDAEWKQFRRDQVTALVRKVYLAAIDLKPQIKISAATITWTPSPTADTLAEWQRTSAYSSVLQDWRAWMEEGILDLNIPMAYFRHEERAADWANWNRFIKNRRYQRHAAPGAGIYLNTISNSIVQFRSTRTTTSQGYRADGLVGYSYAVPDKDDLGRTVFFAALTSSPNAYDTNSVPLFPSATNPPTMTWKTSPTRGHLKGYVIRTPELTGVDGATVQLSGSVQRTLVTDATGFYGAVDLLPGSYTLTVSPPGLLSETTTVTITAGQVFTQSFMLAPPSGADFFADLRIWPGQSSTIISWTTKSNALSGVLYGPGTNLTHSTSSAPTAITHHEVLLSGLSPDADYALQLVAESDTNQWSSPVLGFRTAGTIIIDNPDASFSGTWTPGTSSADKYLVDYAYAGAVTGAASATATFTPSIATPGRYDVYVWYPQGSNRSTNAPFLIQSASGSPIVRVNQTTGGGAWRLLAANRTFDRGTTGKVVLSNNTGESSRVVLADAVRFSYTAGQDNPAPGSIPLWWADYYFGSAVSGTLDHDRDGYDAYAEYVVGTSPVDAGAHLRMGMGSGVDDQPAVWFAPWHSGRSYQLEVAADPAAGPWVNLSHAPPQSTPTGEGRITDASGIQDHRFYRLRVTLTP